MIKFLHTMIFYRAVVIFTLTLGLLFSTVGQPHSQAQEDDSQKIQQHQERLQKMREAEARQNQAMLSPEILQALEKHHNGKSDEPTRALLFMNNDLINRAGLLGVIDNEVYQSAQKNYAKLNEGFGKKAAISAKAKFRVQQRDPDKPFDPGTDSDYITEVTSPDQIEKMQGFYNNDVNVWLHEQGVLDKPRSDWHNKLDTDFMADQKLVNKKQFEKIAEFNNAAYTKRKAAHYEALSRMTPKQLKAAGYPNGKIPLDLSSAFVDQMEEMGNKNAKKINDILNDPEKLEKLKTDPNERAKLQIYQALEQKYTKRKQEAIERLTQQEGLAGPTAPDRPEITAEDRKFTEDLAKKRKQQHLDKGKSRVESGEISEADLKNEADQVEKNVLKSLEQNQIPVEKPLSDLPREAAKRAKDKKTKSQAASALSRHLSDQATKGYTGALAELAGKDSANEVDGKLAEASTRGYREKLAEEAGKDPSLEKDAQRDIAQLTKDLPNKEKTETVNRAVEQFKKAYNKSHPDQKPETVEKKAAEFKRGLEKEMQPHFRPDVNIEKETQKSIAEKSQGLSASGQAEMHEDAVRQYERGAINERMKQGEDEKSAKKNSAKDVDQYSRGLAREMQKLKRSNRSKNQKGETPPGKAAGKIEAEGKQPSSEGTTKPRESIKGGPRDVVVFSKKAKIKPIDNRKTPLTKSRGSQEDVLSIGQALTGAFTKVGKAGVGLRKQEKALQEWKEALNNNDFDKALRKQRTAAKYRAKVNQDLGDAVEEGLNAIPLDLLPGLGGDDKTKSAIAPGTVLRSLFNTGKKFGESKYSLTQAEKYAESAKEAEKRGEPLIANKLRQLAADSQFKSAEKVVEGMRETPISGTGYRLREAWVLSDKVKETRQRAKEALERDNINDINIAQKLYERSRMLEKKKQENIDSALDHLPLFGLTAEKFGGLGKGYAQVYKKLDKSDEYKANAEKMRERGEYRKAEKYEALAGKARNEAHKELTKMVESTPVVSTMQNFQRSFLEASEARTERAMAEMAAENGNHELAARHLRNALVLERKSEEHFNKFKENAPLELAALLTAAASDPRFAHLGRYAPALLAVIAAYKIGRSGMEYTEKGQRIEKAKTEGLAALISKFEDAKRKLQGEDTDDEIALKSLSGAEKAWLKKLDNKEVRLIGKMTRDEFINALRGSRSGSRRPSSMSNLGDLGAYIEVVPKPGSEKPEIFQRGDSSTPSLEHGGHEDPSLFAKLPPQDSEFKTESSEDKTGISLPGVIGLGLKEAASLIQTAGLNPVIEVGDETSDPYKVDTIATQSPAAGNRVEEGSDVIISVYSEAIDSGNVPSVIGMGLKEAVAAIQGAGLSPLIEVGDETSDPEKVGTIAWQGPSAGDEVEEGSEVTLSVYTEGVPGREVPNLVGMSLARAKRLLESRDLFIEPVREKAASRRNDENKIYKQYPEPGLEVPNGIGIRAWAYKEFKEKTSTGPLVAIEFSESIGWVNFHPDRTSTKLIRSSRGWKLMRPAKGWDIGKAFGLSREANVHRVYGGPAYNNAGTDFLKTINVELNWAERNDPGTIDCSQEMRRYSSEAFGSKKLVHRVTSPHIQAVVEFRSPLTHELKSWWPNNEAFRKFAQHVFRQLEPHAKSCRGSKRKTLNSVKPQGRRGTGIPRDFNPNVPYDPCGYVMGMPNPSPECN